MGNEFTFGELEPFSNGLSLYMKSHPFIEDNTYYAKVDGHVRLSTYININKIRKETAGLACACIP